MPGADALKKGKTPILNQEEAHALLESIDVTSVVGLRDRALITTMIYAFGRVGAVIKMRVEDYYSQRPRGWMRLHEKGASVMRCRVITSSRRILMRILPLRALPRIERVIYFERCAAAAGRSRAFPWRRLMCIG